MFTISINDKLLEQKLIRLSEEGIEAEDVLRRAMEKWEQEHNVNIEKTPSASTLAALKEMEQGAYDTHPSVSAYIASLDAES